LHQTATLLIATDDNYNDSIKVTGFSGVPTMYWALLTYEDREHQLVIDTIAGNFRFATSGGASLPMEILKGFEKKYKALILEGYGLSETSPVVTFNHIHKERKPGSVGTPIWGVEVQIVDIDSQPLSVGEVGEVLMTHPAVSLAAVIGVPHESHGEEIKAFIIVKAGQAATEADIVAWSKEQMAAYKYPRFVEIRETLPMTATGKVLKKLLKAEADKG
jgi:acyl-CoA synthetase (AMP-forming)/AMP-acid ligase II